MSAQIQCAKCYCTLYFTNGNYSGTTGEICSSCQAEKDNNDVNYYDDDDDD